MYKTFTSGKNMIKGSTFGFIVLFVFHSVQSFALPHIQCTSLFTESKNSYSSVKQDFIDDINSPEQAIRLLEIRSNEVIPIKGIGAGISGHVFEVSYLGEKYALKLFNAKWSDLQIEKNAVLIQRALGNLDLAPKVIGVLNKSEVAAWMDKAKNLISFLPNRYKDITLEHQEEIFPVEMQFGLLMELTEAQTLKETFVIPVTASEHNKLQRDADEIAEALLDLGIFAQDIDAVITSQKRLKLIDLGFFRYDPSKASSVIQTLRMLISQHTGHPFKVSN